MRSPWRAFLIGAVLGPATIVACSGVFDCPATSPDLAGSPCGGTDLTEIASPSVSQVRRIFRIWPTPTIYWSEDALADGAVGCFDGQMIVVGAPQADDLVILAHEICHAIAHLEGGPVPVGFPVPERPLEAHAMDEDLWAQEMWATTCSSAMVGDEDWSWGGIARHGDLGARDWARRFVEAGPSPEVESPSGWEPAPASSG